MTSNDAIQQWCVALNQASADGSFVKLQLQKPNGTGGDLKSIEARPILVKRQPKLSFTYHHKTRDIVKNYTAAEAIPMLRTLLGNPFTNAMLYTTHADMQLMQQKGEWQLHRRQASHTETPDLSHDRAKQHLVTGGAYLHALGITDGKGNVYKTTQDKFRQINKYIEILDGLIKQLPSHETLRVTDMGAGKGYLTFALYDHLVNKLGMKAEIIGVETRADLVATCNDIAAAAEFSGLSFVQNTIAGYDCSGAHVVIALHACDTATDDAIAKAVHAGAELIVMAPCCHKQLRRAMDIKKADAAFGFLLRHGTYAERMAEMLTDGMRTQLLELAGYRTKLFEFIADAHTPKNVMIVGMKAAPLHGTEHARIRAELNNALERFAITHHALDRLLAKH